MDSAVDSLGFGTFDSPARTRRPLLTQRTAAKTDRTAPHGPKEPALITQTHVPTLYLSPTIQVTQRWLARHGRRYDIANLSDAVVVRGPVHYGVFVSLAVALASALLLLPAALLLSSASLFAAGLIATLVPCPIAWGCLRRWPPRRELWARYRGAAVCLFLSRDEREFGQVSRAVRRAIEAARRDRP
jgi:hypothetical protein